jgi:hypothetical protein
LEAVASLAGGLDARTGVLIYPEGTRFTPEKLERALAQLREQGKEELAARAEKLRYVLPPKLGGPQALLSRAPGVDVLLLEHTGFEGTADFASFWGGELIGRTLEVRFRRIAAGRIPQEDVGGWLFDRWVEMDAWVAGRLAEHAGVRSLPGLGGAREDEERRAAAGS